MTAWDRNLRIVYYVRICFSLLFSIAVITLFWTKYGLDLLDIFWLQALFSLAVVCFEIPTGYIGDKLGRRRTLQLACLLAACGWLLYSLSRCFWQFLTAELVLGLAFSFLSGTDTSLVYESLQEAGKTDTFTRLEGRQHGAQMAAEALSTLAGGVLAMFLPVPWLLAASGAAALTALIACLGIAEPRRQAYEHPRGTWYGLYKIARFIFLRSRVVRFVVPFMAAAMLSTMLGVWLYQPLWQDRRIPVWLFGVLWAAISLPAVLTSHFADRIEKRIGPKKLLWLLPLPPLLGYLFLACVPGWPALAGAYVVNLLRGLTFPVLGRYIHAETFSDKRATVMSVASWVFRLGYFLAGPLVGWIGRDYSFTAAFAACAVVSLIGLGVFLPALSRAVGSPEPAA